MSDLYEKCPFCKGKGTLAPDTKMCIDPPNTKLERAANGEFVCIGCGGEKYVETGLSMGQVDRMIAELARLKAEAKMVASVQRLVAEARELPKLDDF